MRVQPGNVELRLLPVPTRDDRLALVVHLKHQPGRLLEAVAEELLEHERDVRHEVDRVVPDDDYPRPLVLDIVLDDGLTNFDFGRRGEGAHAAAGSAAGAFSKTSSPSFP